MTLENNRLLDKHRRELADRVKYNQNCLKKSEKEQEDDFDNEVKRFQQEQTRQYRIQKDIFKKVIQYLFFLLLNKKNSFSRIF